MTATAAPQRATFKRDHLTWLSYAMLAYYAYLQAALGPLMPFLRAELDLNYTLAGLHLSAFALGMALAGLMGDRAAARFGRHAVYWGGGAGMGLGALLLAAGQTPLLTIASAFVMGFVGSFLLVMIQAVLADHHGEQRSIPLTEANVAAVGAAGLAPILVGAGEQIGVGWRAALLIVAALWLVAFIISRRTAFPTGAAPTRTQTTRARLPRIFWLYWGIAGLSVAVEWSLIFWGADFLEKVVGLERVAASTLMSVFFGAMFIGRFIGSRLARLYNVRALLLAAIGMLALGFPLLWLAEITALNLIGLFLAGLGVANFYPLTLAAAMETAPGMENISGSRISLASGLAILIAPQILGSAADQIGIFNAFGIAGTLIVSAFVLIMAARRVSHR
jgi:MFS family permease